MPGRKKKDEDAEALPPGVKPIEDAPDANRDPISGAAGAHPVGSGVGAAGGAAVGAVVGAAITGPAAPLGALIGGVVGGIAGGLLGKGVAEAVNPTIEDDYWRANYADRPYARPGDDYATYQPAYQFGWESCCRVSSSEPTGGRRSFDDVEPELRRDWQEAAGDTGMDWDRAREPARDAWTRVEGLASGAAENAERQSDSQARRVPDVTGGIAPAAGFDAASALGGVAGSSPAAAMAAGTIADGSAINAGLTESDANVGASAPIAPGALGAPRPAPAANGMSSDGTPSGTGVSGATSQGAGGAASRP